MRGMHALLFVAYAGVLSVLAVYGLHRSYLVGMCWRLRDRLRQIAGGVPPVAREEIRPGSNLPYVTIQLPIYNEATVAPRLLEQIALVEWPKDRLELQILDDSTDETSQLVRPHLARLRAMGFDVAYLHRKKRTGYKAGALEAGLKVAKGDFIAMFDADFLPPPDFLRRVAPHFSDPKVGMVQGRWGHLNRERSVLTRVEALMLDGHHIMENRIRYAADWCFNFAGTGGIWRKAAIESSGGWHHDTLTEDLDLSYRAQLRGWKFVYREDVVVPAELPEDVLSFRAQQFRWAKGTAQTRRKLLRALLKSDLPFGAKVEAFFHLTPNLAYPLTMLLSLLLLPLVFTLRNVNTWTMVIIDLPLFLGTTGSLAAFYSLTESYQGRRWLRSLETIPALLVVGVGLTPIVAKALWEGQRGIQSEFVRTPKKGSSSVRYAARKSQLPVIEAALCVWSFATLVATIQFAHYVAAPFALMFTCGYGFMACQMVSEGLANRRTLARVSPVALPSVDIPDAA